ncbi:unnamed protein product [Camellia sinensis]
MATQPYKAGIHVSFISTPKSILRVVLPIVIDQPSNARLLVEKGLAIEVERGEDGSFSGNEWHSSVSDKSYGFQGRRRNEDSRRENCCDFQGSKAA